MNKIAIVSLMAVFLVLPACAQDTSEQKDSKEMSTGLPPQEVAAVTNLPLPDFSGFSDVKAKKHAFFNYLAPLVNAENENIYALRESLEQLEKRELSDDELLWLTNLAKKYKIQSTLSVVDSGFWTELKKRIDVVPASLVLAQAANESAWGTSRFAREGNNLFGQWCFSKGCGLIPKSRNKGATHEVAVFSSPQASVASYMKNINTNSAYQALRDRREQRRLENTAITGEDLAKGLINYSERGEAYISELQAMIRTNRLQDFEKTYLYQDGR